MMKIYSLSQYQRFRVLAAPNKLLQMKNILNTTFFKGVFKYFANLHACLASTSF